MVERSNPLEAIAPTGAELAGKMNRIEPDHFEQFNDQLQNAQNALQQAKDNLATSDVELNDRQSAQLNQLMENFYQGGSTKLNLMARANMPLLEVKSSTAKGMTFSLAGDDRDITVQTDGSLALFNSQEQIEPSALFGSIDELVGTINFADVDVQSFDASMLTYAEKINFETGGIQTHYASQATFMTSGSQTETNNNGPESLKKFMLNKGHKMILNHPTYNTLSVNQIFAKPQPKELIINQGGKVIRAYLTTKGYIALNGPRKGERPYIYQGYEVTNMDHQDTGFSGKGIPAGGFSGGINYRWEDGYNHRIDDLLASYTRANTRPPVLRVDYSLTKKDSMIPVIAHPKWENGQWNYHDENGDYVPVYNHTMLSLQETIDHKKEIKEALTNINYQVSDVQDQLTDFRQHANLYTEYFNEFHNGKLDIENSSIRIDDNNIQFTFDDAYTNQRYNIDRKITLSTVSNPDGSINTGLLKSAIAKEISSIVLENKVIQEDVEINNKTLNTEFAEACNPINMGKNSCGRSVRGILKKFGVTGIPEYGCDGCKRDDILTQGSKEKKFSHNGKKIIFKEQYCKTPFDAPEGAIVVFGKNAQHPNASNARRKYGHVEVMCDEGRFNHYLKANHAGGSASLTKNESTNISRNECMRKTGFTGHAYVMEYV